VSGGRVKNQREVRAPTFFSEKNLFFFFSRDLVRDIATAIIPYVATVYTHELDAKPIASRVGASISPT
jgi:hypothetical protein